MRNSFLLAFSILLFSCSNQDNNTVENTIDTATLDTKKVELIFNEDSAYAHVFNQVNFGPRVPGTKEHAACHAYIVKFLKSLADTVILQNATAITFDKKTIPIMNIIASFNPKASKRILLAAHWDTRPFADQDTKDQDKPILGANDGGSGVGVLMEIASVLKQNPLSIGIDIIFFDAEDWGGKEEDSYCLGSQFWGKNPHIPNYKADFGILLDMVGASDALFGFETHSLNGASSYLSMVWAEADKAGYGNYFKNFPSLTVTDDHYYVMKHRQFPMIDIIHTDPKTQSFGKFWHTHKDNMDAIDKRTLKAVGQTVVNVLSKY